MKKFYFHTIVFICVSIIPLCMYSPASADSLAGTGQLKPPTGLTPVAAGQNSVDISWDAMEGVSAYDLYRNGKIVNRVSGSSYMDKGLKEYSVYRYQIQAIYQTGKSERSESRCVRTWEKPNEGTDGSVVCPPQKLRIVVK
jgi:hypothetical protein